LAFTQKEIATIFHSTGSRKRTDLLDFLFAKNTNKNGRILVIISRKVANAPKRNKLRRRLKSIFLEENLLHGPIDCIVICKIGSADLPFAELKIRLINAYKEYTTKENIN